MGYLYILLTIIFTVYGQLIIKWRVNTISSFPDKHIEKLLFVATLVIDPYILSGLISAFVASLFWIAAMTKLELSYAYPFVGLTFVLVLFFSVVLLHEPLTIYKIIGLSFIIIGIIISSRSL